MATCPTCGGYGQVEGDFPPCYSCGGRGCNACHGTGRGGMRAMNTCYICGGAGKVADNWQLSGVTASRGLTKGNVRRVPWTNQERLIAFVSFAVICAVLTSYFGGWNWMLPFIAVLPAMFLGRFWKGLTKLVIALGVIAALFWLFGDPARFR